MSKSDQMRKRDRQKGKTEKTSHAFGQSLTAIGLVQQGKGKVKPSLYIARVKNVSSYYSFTKTNSKDKNRFGHQIKSHVFGMSKSDQM